MSALFTGDRPAISTACHLAPVRNRRISILKLQLFTRFVLAALALALPISVLADFSDTKTLTTATGALNLDTGAVASAGGDILWNGRTITLQGNAKAFNIGVAGTLNGLSKSTLDAFKTMATSATLPSSTLVIGDVFAVFTNGGNTAAVLVTANDTTNSSITLTYTSFGGTGGSSGGPTITKILNNSSLIPAGFPNSGIAPSTLFQILGSGLADFGDATLHDSLNTLPLTLNGASVTVTIGNVTVHPALYYATPTQIDAVLPAATPTGTATVTVTYKGTVSNSFTNQVVTAAPGFTTYNGTAVAQHVSGALVTLTASAAPGETIILWGTGLGADPVDSDTTYTTTPHQTIVSYTVYIGGVPATIIYQGASVYPGVSVFGLTVPQSVPTGCYVPIVAVTGSFVSNTAILPIHAGGGTCADPQLGFSGDQILTFRGKATVNSGTVLVSQSTSPGAGGTPSVSSNAVAIFNQAAGSSYGVGGSVSIGGCLVTETIPGPSVAPIGLSTGTITVTGPGGTPVTLTVVPGSAGIQAATLTAIPSTGGAFVFNSSIGTQVGGFITTVSFPNPLLSWTNQSAATTVNRSQGLSVNWSGGSPGTYVTISGSSVSGSATGSYVCIAPQSAGTFTVPSYVLLALPAGTGTTTVQNSTNFMPFVATGLDIGNAIGQVSITVNSNFN
ncbi:MAG: repeat containing protein [Bryobacterales bacterium]|nr:repeat containing protein [Bryobacterales bacterium]